MVERTIGNLIFAVPLHRYRNVHHTTFQHIRVEISLLMHWTRRPLSLAVQPSDLPLGKGAIKPVGPPLRKVDVMGDSTWHPDIINVAIAILSCTTHRGIVLACEHKDLARSRSKLPLDFDGIADRRNHAN